MSLRKIRLELARSHDFPEGSAAHGYEFWAPLDRKHHIDATAWKRQRQDCRVRRFWSGAPDAHGLLVHRANHRWAFHYAPDEPIDEDEPGYRFDSHAFRPGEYVSITEADGVTRTFKVASVD